LILLLQIGFVNCLFTRCIALPRPPYRLKNQYFYGIIKNAIEGG